MFYLCYSGTVCYFGKVKEHKKLERNGVYCLHANTGTLSQEYDCSLQVSNTIF